jgi:hypothetical protein
MSDSVCVLTGVYLIVFVMCSGHVSYLQPNGLLGLMNEMACVCVCMYVCMYMAPNMRQFKQEDHPKCNMCIKNEPKLLSYEVFYPTTKITTAPVLKLYSLHHK